MTDRPSSRGRRTRRRRGAALVVGLIAVLLLGASASQATAPTNLTPPTVTGTAQIGQTLTEVHGTWMPAAVSYTYQWYHCVANPTNCQPITGATAQTYVVAPSDGGMTIEVYESADGGAPAFSAMTAVVPAVAAPTLTTGPSITGKAYQGQTLTEVHGTWTGSPTGYNLLWADCDATGNACAPISGATMGTYVPSAADLGHTIRVLEVALNAGGMSAPAASVPTAVVVVPPQPPVNIIAPVISGTPHIGRTLSCTQGTWGGTEPISYAYSWSDDTQAIQGATSSSYTLGPGELAQAVICSVIATNVAGSVTAASPTVLVTSAPPCDGLSGLTKRNCQAKTTYALARSHCGTISRKTASSRARRSACLASALLTYHRALALAKCASIKGNSKRVACNAKARKLKK